MPVSPDFCHLFVSIIVRKANAVASGFRPRVFLAIPLPMGYHAHRGSAAGVVPLNSQPMTPILNPTRIYVDADACPVKDEIYRVAARHGLPVSVVAGNFIRVPQDPLIERIAAGSGMDAADDWIAERAGKGDIVTPSRIPRGERRRKGRRRGDRAERQAVYGTIDRNDAGGPQSDDRFTVIRRGDRRPQIVRTARPLGVPVGTRSSHPPHPAPAPR